MLRAFPFPTRFVSLGALLLFWGCGASEREQAGFFWKNGQLLRGARPFRILAVQKQILVEPECNSDERALELNEICYSGGNSAAVRLVHSDGEIGNRFREQFLGLNRDTRWRSMGLVLRIPGVDETLGKKIVSQIAYLFPDSWDVVYWFEGPNGSTLATMLEERTGFVTAASTGNNLKVAGRAESSGPEYLILDPDSLDSAQTHYLFSDEARIHVLTEEILNPYNLPSLPSDQSSLSDAERGDGFISLFDGRSFEGWNVTGDPTLWAIEDNSISWKGQGGGEVRTRRRFANFVLRFEWRIQEEEGNSGVFLRAPLGGRSSRIGMEFQLMGDADTEPHKNGTGAIYDVIPPTVNASNPVGQWNSVEVICDHSHFEATLNGQHIHSVELDRNPILRLRLRNGVIAFQDHGSPVQFRNIRLKEL